MDSSDSSIESESATNSFWDSDSGKGTIAGLVLLSLVVIGLIVFIIVWFVTRVNSSGSTFTMNWVSPVIANGGTASQTANYTFDDTTLLTTVTVPAITIPLASNVNAFGLIAPGNSSFPSKLAYQNGGQNSYFTTTTAVSFSSTSGTAHKPIAVTATLYPDGSISIVPFDGTTFFGAANGTSITIHEFQISYNAGTGNPTLNYATTTLQFDGSFVVGGSTSTTLYYSTFTSNGQNGTILALPTVAFNTNAQVGSVLTSATALPSALRPLTNLSEPLFSATFNNGLPDSGTVAIDTSGNVTLTNTTGTFNPNQVGVSFGFAGGFYPSQ